MTEYSSFLSSLLTEEHASIPAAHRGAWRDSPENSLSAIHKCIERGVKVIEVDVQITKDQHLILMHDESIDRMTNGSGQIIDFTLAELNQFYLKSNQGGDKAPLTIEKIPTLLEALHAVNGRALIMLDKSWELRELCYSLINKTGALDHALFISGESIEEVQAFLDSKPEKPLYMHRIYEKNVSQLNRILAALKPDVLCIHFPYDTSIVVDEAVMRKMRRQSVIWVNALDISANGGRTDTLSKINPKLGWGWFREQGMNIIQTDYPFELLHYFNKK